MRKNSAERIEHERQALSLMEEALDLLDRSDRTLEVAPHLDLAICRLREVMGPLAPIRADCELPEEFPTQAAGVRRS